MTQFAKQQLAEQDVTHETRVSQNTSRNLFSKLLMATVFVGGLSACGQAPQSISSEMISSDAGILNGVGADGSEDFSKSIVGLFDSRVGGVCTASILTDSILVTAAHCLESEPSALRIVFGTDFNARGAIIREVDAYQVSPLWPYRQSAPINTGDIALVKFSGGLPPGYKRVNFVGDLNLLKDGMDVLIAGFGTSQATPARDPRTGATFTQHSGASSLRYGT
ncbi:MAG: trypsin-like serine protease, partial [Bdellovibrionales bacterium]|nr:trypsin-like serine protease [Bdellovibrionales bacterium]